MVVLTGSMSHVCLHVSSETPARLRRPELRAWRDSAGAGWNQRPEAPEALAAVHGPLRALAAHLCRDHQQRHAALRQWLGERGSAGWCWCWWCWWCFLPQDIWDWDAEPQGQRGHVTRAARGLTGHLRAARSCPAWLSLQVTSLMHAAQHHSITCCFLGSKLRENN